MKQWWFCETCGIVGFVNIDEHAAVFDVVTALADCHREKSPSCQGKLDTMRLVSPNHVRWPSGVGLDEEHT